MLWNLISYIRNVILQNKLFSIIYSFLYLFYPKRRILSKGTKKQKILFVQTIFAIDEETLNINLESIRSLVKYTKEYPSTVEIKFCFSGRTYNDESRNKIENLIKRWIVNSTIKRFETNCWKATYVNTTIKEISKNYNWTSLFTLDSDIIFSLDSPYLFDRLIYAISEAEKLKNQKYWVIAPQHISHNINYLNALSQNSFRYNYKLNTTTYKEQLIYGNMCVWIAWLCWLINRELREDVWWYSFVWKYGPDDWLLLKKCVKLWYSRQVVNSLFVVHPNIKTNENYNQLKTIAMKTWKVIFKSNKKN